jgi:protein-S-isoprenylcysteine O-methyltransferase Ste14
VTDIPESPGVRFPPPTLFAAGFVLAWLLETRVARVRLVGGTASPLPLEVAGVLLGAAGLALVGWGLVTFRRARTGIYPTQSASRVVDAGPYRFTRNPMYVGMTLLYVGLALAANTAWPFVLLPAVLWALHALVIRREERYLRAAFGEAYDAYCRRVRRWL